MYSSGFASREETFIAGNTEKHSLQVTGCRSIVKLTTKQSLCLVTRQLMHIECHTPFIHVLCYLLPHYIRIFLQIPQVTHHSSAHKLGLSALPVLLALYGRMGCPAWP